MTELLIMSGMVFILSQLFYYALSTPERMPRSAAPRCFDKVFALSLYALAYIFSLLRLPFAVLPYCLKLLGVLILKKHYKVSHYDVVIEALRIGGDFMNWRLGVFVIEKFSATVPFIRYILIASIFAEAIRLLAEKGQMIVSALWQLLPHRLLGRHLKQKLSLNELQSAWSRSLLRYCQYYSLDDTERIQYILSTLRGYAATDAEASAKLAYLSTLSITASSHGMRGGHVRDVARGEVFVHRQWTADPWLLIGQALRRTPWMFDPRYLRRPFTYRTESNRLATLFVLVHFRYCPTYAFYQFGHEIKAARYDLFYRMLRCLKADIEPKVQADGTFPFDQGITWLDRWLHGNQVPAQVPLWSDEDALVDIRGRIMDGENLTALDIAVQYTYPLKYIEEVFIQKLGNTA